MLTAKENYLRCLRGEVPEWVPQFTMGMPTVPGEAPPDIVLEPGIVNEHRIRGGGKDFWGVEYVPTTSTGNALIPKTSDFILDDITKWRDVIKAPDFSGVDWEAEVKKDTERIKLDRSKTALCMGIHMGYFQLLMSFMGFSNGLMAFYEEPDEVKALFEYMSDFYCDIVEHYIEYCDPDYFILADDTAAWANPFISPDMYREFLIPMYIRLSKCARDRGLPIAMHNCGKCEGIIDDLVNIGVTQWNPAQTCNDLVAVKKRHGNKLVIAGGWDARGDLLRDDVTYEEIYASVKKTFDDLAPGGGFAFCGGYLGAVGDESVIKKNAMVQRAVAELDHKYY